MPVFVSFPAILRSHHLQAGLVFPPIASLPPIVSVGQYFEQALVARLRAIPEITAIVGLAIFKTGIPQTWDFGTQGPALTYVIPEKPMGHVLTGSDGTATATVDLGAWSYNYGTSKRLIEAIANGIDGIPGIWGDGPVIILSVVQHVESDELEPPKAGSDQWVYHVSALYSVKYRVSIPRLF